MKKVVLVHGWGGSPESDWFLWLRDKLEEKGFEVIALEMPDTFHPNIKSWIQELNKIKEINNNTYFIGHSIGCQAIMRYLEQLSEQIKIGGVIFVAAWFYLTDNTWDEYYTKEIADPWINIPLDFDKIKTHTNKFVSIQSDNDPYVSLSNKDILKEKLGAKIIIEHNKCHFAGEEGIKELPILFEELMEMMK